MKIDNIIVLLISLSFAKSQTSESNATDFVPNSEWQEIKQGKNQK